MKNILILISLLLPLFCFSQDNNMPRQVGICTEEDYYPILIFDNLDLDQNYTLGFGINYSEKNCSSYLTRLRRSINKIGKKKSDNVFRNADYQSHEINLTVHSSNSIIAINGAGFTPDSLQKPDISYNDRPYSSLLSISSSQTYFKKDFLSAKTYSLSIGIYGLGLAKSIQTKIHKSMNENDTKDPHTPKGWRHQISDGFEPSFLYKIRTDYLLSKNNIRNSIERSYYDFSTSFEILLGYYTGISGEFNGRIGCLDSRNWQSKFNNLANVNKAPEENTFLTSKDRLFEAYIFYSLKPSIILYNESLSGGFRKTSYRLSPITEANPFIIEFSVGLGFNIPVGCKNERYINMGYTPLALRTPEMWGSKISRVHYWGGIFLNYIY